MRTHSDINSRVHAERSFFGGEGLPGPLHSSWVACADVALGDELVIEVTLCSCIVWLAHTQKAGRQRSGHHLTAIHKDVCGEQPESKDTCRERKAKQLIKKLTKPLNVQQKISYIHLTLRLLCGEYRGEVCGEYKGEVHV